jgi:cobalamin biosynthesis protein CobT
MARRILNRKELRADYDAAERRQQDEEEDVEEEEGEDEEDDEEAESDEEAGDEEAESEAEEEEAPAKKKKPAAKPKATKPRSRAGKSTRLRVIWGVFNNSHQMVASYEYPRRKEADDHAAKLTADKKSTHFVQPVKEPMEQK